MNILRVMLQDLCPVEVAEIAEAQACDCDQVLSSIECALAELPQCDDRRDVSTIELPQSIHWITGGMSWGDLPTEAFEIFATLTSVATILQQIQAWSIEDGPCTSN